MLLTALLVHVQKHLVTGETLKYVLKLEPSRKITLENEVFGVNLANMVASEVSNRLPSSQWSIRQALHLCLLIRNSSNYKPIFTDF